MLLAFTNLGLINGSAIPFLVIYCGFAAFGISDI